MLRATVVLTLLTVSLSYPVQITESDWCRDFDTNVEILEKHGFTEEEIEALIQEDEETIDNEDYSWNEAKGYEECKDWEGKKDWESVEGRYKIFEERDENTGGRHHQGKQGQHPHPHACNKVKPLDEICAEVECPKMEKLDNITGCGFEARKVFGANWALTPIDVSDMDSSYSNAYYKLRNYLNGGNDQEAQLSMAVPVLKTWFLDENYKLEIGFMHFYIPTAFQKNPPVPTDHQVSVVTWPDVVIYDRAFVGHRTDARTYNMQLQLLWRALEKHDIEIYPYVAITAGYTMPGYGRQRNEVMFVDNRSIPSM